MLLLLLYHHHTPYYYKKNYDSQLFQSLFKLTIKEENLIVDPGMIIIIINNNRRRAKNCKIETPRLLVSSFSCPAFFQNRDSVEDTEVFIK